MGASSQREPTPDGPQRDKFEALVTPDSKRSAASEEYILGSDHGLPKAYGHGMQSGWRMAIGIGDEFESKSLASTNRNQRRSSLEYAVGARLVVFAPDGRRDRCDVADVE